MTHTSLTHVDETGAARMVDVSSKHVSARLATAAGTVRTTAKVIDLLRRDALPKGDALAVARVAAIMGAKHTPDLVPLCHPIALHGVTVQLNLGDESVHIEVTTKTADRTGVDDMRSLAAILIQADRFGSSIAQALRVQSDSMRTRRRQMAEEKAAKTAVQLIFPLVLFIFPGIFVVLVGPAAIQINNQLLTKMK